MWVEAFITALILTNKLPSTKLQKQTPKLYEGHPDYKSLVVGVFPILEVNHSTSFILKLKHVYSLAIVLYIKDIGVTILQTGEYIFQDNWCLMKVPYSMLIQIITWLPKTSFLISPLSKSSKQVTLSLPL